MHSSWVDDLLGEDAAKYLFMKLGGVCIVGDFSLSNSETW